MRNAAPHVQRKLYKLLLGVYHASNVAVRVPLQMAVAMQGDFASLDDLGACTAPLLMPSLWSSWKSVLAAGTNPLPACSEHLIAALENLFTEPSLEQFIPMELGRQRISSAAPLPIRFLFSLS